MHGLPSNIQFRKIENWVKSTVHDTYTLTRVRELQVESLHPKLIFFDKSMKDKDIG